MSTPNFDINHLFGVKGIVAVITGGSSGLGLSIAKVLASVAFLELLDAGNKTNTLTQTSSIIITTSIAGFSRLIAAGPSYSASKAGANHLVKLLATQLTPYKIRVNGIAPGIFQTEMTTGNPLFKTEEPWKEGGMGMEACPLERSGSEEDIAGLALFMASKGGGYLSGNIILPDGGRLGQMPATY